MEPPKSSAITVTQFLGIINETLNFAYPSVEIEGEVSSFKINQGKFVFFDLKDETNVLSCFMMAMQLKLPIEDGMRVRVTATPKVTKGSRFSLTIKHIEIAGEGALRRAMELLKRKLDQEGLFDPARKRALPAFPKNIGLITSATSAAYADFIKILQSRWGGLNIALADVTVQGHTAPDQIVNALDYFNAIPQPMDVIVVIRGGGALEDLMAFSTEPVARAIAMSRTPTIVGVGHEVDISLADLAADVRAATPTDAARLVVPDRLEIIEKVNHLKALLNHRLDGRTQGALSRIAASTNRLERYLEVPRRRLATYEHQIWRALDGMNHRRSLMSARVGTTAARLGGFDRLVLAARRQRLDHLGQLLDGYNPTSVLRRGYAIVRFGSKVIRASSSVKPGDTLMIQLAKDQLEAEVR